MISVGKLIYVLQKWLAVIALATLVPMSLVVGWSLLQTPKYEASIKILVGQVAEPEDALSLQNLTLTVAEAIDSRPVADAVIGKLDLRTTPEKFLEDNMSVEEVPDTQFIVVSYTASNPEKAQRVANTIGTTFSEQSAGTMLGSDSAAVTVYERAMPPDTPVSPNPLRNGFLALVMGGVLGVWLAFLLEYLEDNEWQSPKEAEQASEASTDAVMPQSAPTLQQDEKTERLNGNGDNSSDPSRKRIG